MKKIFLCAILVFMILLAGCIGEDGRRGNPGANANLRSVYPVGSVYLTYTNTSPTTILHFGNWELQSVTNVT
jgi:hypothetical protein